MTLERTMLFVSKRRWARPRPLATALASVALAAVGLIPAAAPAAADTPCQNASNGVLFVTASCTDPALAQPFIDIDEHRTTTDAASNVTLSYRYIHGGFTGTSARFSFYFPPAAQYRGRFFEPTYPTLGQEDILQNPESIGGGTSALAFALTHGASVVLSNNGGGVQNNPALGGYRVNAATAKFSRVVAAKVYGDIARPRGYLFGASGGAYQTLGGAESTSGVWDGFVPMVPGVPNAIPNFQAAQVLALRVLQGKFAQIDDAVEPGGSGDPFAGLNAEQRDTLLEVTRLGIPLRGWWQWQALNGGSFSAVAGGVRAIDPTYVNDFWTVPGYEGANPASPVQAARIQYDTTVASLVGAPVTGVVLAGVPSGDLANADLVITSGAAAGKSVTIESATGTTIQFPSADPAIRNALQPGDHVRVDNSWLLALQYYPRYQVPSPDQYAWNQYRNANRTPKFPQRPMLAGPFFAKISGEATPLTPFTGKMIMLASTMDVQALPWSADWYRSQAQKMFGAQVNGHYRLWFMDNADHDPNGPAVTTAPHAAAHIVSYVGEFQQALLDLDAWVAHGRAPAPTSTYTVDANTQVHVPTASDPRGGLQPVVRLSARSCAVGQCVTSDSRIDVKAGQPVRFSIAARTQLGTGSIVRTEWDFNGLGTYPVQSPLTQPRGVVFQGMTFTFMKPGTYFPVVRVSAQRDTHDRYGVIQNLARVRVVVH